MSRKYMNDEMFNELVQSMEEASAIIKGEMKPSRVFVYSPLNVKKIRENAKKNQEEFAQMIGVSIGTLRNWEQGRRQPEGPALALLRLVAFDPDYVAQVLH